MPGLFNREEGEVSVVSFGAKGDNVTDDTAAIQAAADYCFGTSASPNGTAGNFNNKTLIFPPGRFKITAPILLTKIHGAQIKGAGRFVTQIENHTTNQSVFVTNGAGYCHFRGMYLRATGTLPVFDLNWDGTAGGAALQSNTFMDMFFYGGAEGVKIAAGGFMGSENMFLNCFFLLNTTAGILTSATNALQNSVIGGNVQGCGRAIYIAAGSVPTIQGVGFQQQTTCDIDIQWGSADTYVISGCRSESNNFVNAIAPAKVMVMGCSHISGTGTNGDFAVFNTTGEISACHTVYGRVTAQNNVTLGIRNSVFNRLDWLNTVNLWARPGNNMDANIEIENVMADAGDTRVQIHRRRITAAGSFDYDLTAV